MTRFLLALLALYVVVRYGAALALHAVNLYLEMFL